MRSSTSRTVLMRMPWCARIPQYMMTCVPRAFLPQVFNRANPQYHKGFRRQVESWPSNPVSHYISTLSSYPPRTVIADLGCGDAALARALIPKGYTVLSFDLVSDRAFVIEADIFERLPLPGSEGDSDGSGKSGHGHGHGQVVNVVVCALSLMGTNWPNCIREAWRILRPKCVSALSPTCGSQPPLTRLLVVNSKSLR